MSPLAALSEAMTPVPLTDTVAPDAARDEFAAPHDEPSRTSHLLHSLLQNHPLSGLTIPAEHSALRSCHANSLHHDGYDKRLLM